MHQDYYGLGGGAAGRGAPFAAAPAAPVSSAWLGYRGELPAKITMGLLAAGLLWHLVLLVASLGGLTAFAAANASAHVTLGLFVATVIAFLVWFHRAYEIVHVAEGTIHPPSMAVWPWFVPVFNLFRPYQVATEIWRKTGPVEGGGHSPLLMVWWALFCVGRLCPFWASAHMVRGPEDLISPVILVMGLVELALALSAILVVRTLDGRIRARRGDRSAPATF